jgi:hypothetical protein
VKGVEIHPKARFHRCDHAFTRARPQQLPRKAVQLVGERIIRTGYAHELCKFGLDGSVLLAQYLYLPLNERNGGPTPRMGQPKTRKHRMMSFEKIRVVLQISGNGLFFGFHGRYTASCVNH